MRRQNPVGWKLTWSFGVCLGSELSLGSGWCFWLLCSSYLLSFVVFFPVLNFSIQPQKVPSRCSHTAFFHGTFLDGVSWHLQTAHQGSLDGGRQGQVWDRFEREIHQQKSLRTAVLRYGFPAGSHFTFYSPVCIPTMHGGKWGFFYLSWKKPPTWGNHWVTCQ